MPATYHTLTFRTDPFGSHELRQLIHRGRSPQGSPRCPRIAAEPWAQDCAGARFCCATRQRHASSAGPAGSTPYKDLRIADVHIKAARPYHPQLPSASPHNMAVPTRAAVLVAVLVAACFCLAASAPQVSHVCLCGTHSKHRIGSLAGAPAIDGSHTKRSGAQARWCEHSLHVCQPSMQDTRVCGRTCERAIQCGAPDAITSALYSTSTHFEVHWPDPVAQPGGKDRRHSRCVHPAQEPQPQRAGAALTACLRLCVLLNPDACLAASSPQPARVGATLALPCARGWSSTLASGQLADSRMPTSRTPSVLLGDRWTYSAHPQPCASIAVGDAFVILQVVPEGSVVTADYRTDRGARGVCRCGCDRFG